MEGLKYVIVTHGFIHNAKCHLGLVDVVRCDLRPEIGELIIGRSSLTNNASIPACIVVNIDDAHGGTSIDAALDLLVVGGKVRSVQFAAELVVHQELPAHGDAKDVQARILHKVVHLADTCLGWIDDA